MARLVTDWVKDPDAVLDWKWDWSEWLASGETIATSLVTVSAGIVLDSSTHSLTSVTAWLSGGTDGQIYRVSARVTTNQNRTDERSITIRVTER
jgi:hypothetical protein